MSHSNQEKPNLAQRADQKLNGKKRYQKPALTLYGDVRDITMGPSAGPTDSGTFGKAIGT